MKCKLTPHNLLTFVTLTGDIAAVAGHERTTANFNTVRQIVRHKEPVTVSFAPSAPVRPTCHLQSCTPYLMLRVCHSMQDATLHHSLALLLARPASGQRPSRRTPVLLPARHCVMGIRLRAPDGTPVSLARPRARAHSRMAKRARCKLACETSLGS